MHIVVITHAYENFPTSKYYLRQLSDIWVDAGHRVSVARGLDDWPTADVAILHIDLSVVPEAYAEAVPRYGLVLNGAALDIRKRTVSRSLVSHGDGWSGPVIVKTDLNCGGLPEAFLLRRMRRTGSNDPALAKCAVIPGAYPILRSADEVPDSLWNNPGIVIERFLPERDTRGFWTYAWVFLGNKERCTRYLSDRAIVKNATILASEPAEVPDELRAERHRLGFDYGKFDFVVHDGKAVLFDANKTPAAPPSSIPSAAHVELARGIEFWRPQ